MASRKDWMDWYKKQNPQATDDQVKAALDKKLASMRKPKKEQEESLGAMARRVGKPKEGATREITQETMTRAKRRRTGTTGTSREIPKRGNYSSKEAHEEAVLEWNRNLPSGQGRAIERRTTKGGSQ